MQYKQTQLKSIDYKGKLKYSANPTNHLDGLKIKKAIQPNQVFNKKYDKVLNQKKPQIYKNHWPNNILEKDINEFNH